MPTTVTKSIGSAGGRDYSTLQAWEDACPANLVTADQIWKGECYNDSEFSAGAPALTISGQTTDATRYVWLTTATGQSFRDNASVQTNALRYNQSNGVGITHTANRTMVISIATAYTLFENLQVKTTGTGYAGSWPLDISAANVTVKNCILEDVDTQFSGYVVATGSQSGVLLVNCLVIARMGHANGNGSGIAGFKFGECLNCTFVMIQANTVTGGNACSGGSYDSGIGTFTNCAFFGFFSFRGSLTNGPTCVNCFTDNSTNLPTGITGSKTYSSQFQNISDGTHDFRAKSGGDLIDAGTTDSRASPDIAGTTRPSGSSYDVGAWELVQAGGSTGPLLNGGKLLHGTLIRGGRLVA